MDSGSVVFGRYLLLEKIGAGSAGVVWKATDQQLHQTVALKRVPFAGLDGEQARLTRDRALREARLAAALRSHPHVVTVYDVLADDSDIWLVMEYLPARSLSELLRTEGPLAPVNAARIGAQLADALAAAHTLGIEHRDVKPGNVLIGADGTVKLTDFGISHLTGDPNLTHTGVTGTPAYLAPEVAANGDTSPASDVFSLGATLYCAVEGQPPFGADDNILRLLKVVRTGIIRPPTQAGPLEPLLLRLLHPIPSTRPDAETTRDLLTRLATELTNPTGRARAPKTARRHRPRWWRKPTRRVTVIAAALIAAVTTTTGVITLRTPQALPGQPPSIVPDDPRNADPCSLINLESLHGFGQVAPPTLTGPQTCRAAIIPLDNEQTYLQVEFRLPSKSAVGPNNVPRLIHDRTIVRRDSQADLECQDWLIPITTEPLIVITARSNEKNKSAGLCAVTDAATNAAVSKLERNGITYHPDRLKDYSLARSDACATLRESDLRKVPGLNPSDYSRGFGNWYCYWGTFDAGGPSTEFYFALDELDPAGGELTTIAGRKAYLYYDDNPEDQSCDASVEHRPATTTSAAEQIVLTVHAHLARYELCRMASDLATAAETRLPSSLRTANPCPMLNIDALRGFGEPRLATAPLLSSCQANISPTTSGGDAELRIVLQDPSSVSELEGTPDPGSDPPIIRTRSVQYWGALDTCRNYLVPAPDQPVIAIYALTYSAKPVDLCAMAEAATAAAIETLKRNGGITYTLDRTSVYSHATSDACTSLDKTALDKVPELNLGKQSPSLANWRCTWGAANDNGTRVTLELRLEDPENLQYYARDFKQIPFAEKEAFIDSSNQRICKVKVIHRTVGAALETFEVHVESPRSTEERCAQAAELAAAAEERLPDA